MTSEDLLKRLSDAAFDGKLLPSTLQNISAWLNPQLFESWVIDSIREWVEGNHWEELNDRFYKTLAFGTGGLRGRTIGRIISRGEQGIRSKGECPEHPAVGSNCMNDFNVRRAVLGMVAYLQKTMKIAKPHLIFAHDTRHFSHHFARLAAETVIECGGSASLFESERSTPELSFAVRELGAHAGAVLTASHNPPHDNGFKAYFNDGAQVIEPHASGIIREVNSVSFESVCKFSLRNSHQIQTLGNELDRAYALRLHSLILEKEIVRNIAPKLKIVYTPLHGTGAKMVPALLREMGFQLLTEPDQMKADGRFPTVKSPNPENAEALSRSIQIADREGADLVLATDPDADRMGVAVRNREGRMELLSGNQIGSLLSHYRLERLFARGVLNASNRHHAVLIKTVVTTDLQKAIAEKFGVGLPETLTGFKYIGAKLLKYENQALAALEMNSRTYRALSEDEKRNLLLHHSKYYVFGGEESYGYSASDFTRDKDANAACVMFAELAAFARSQNRTIGDYLDGIYSELGYYQEKLGQLVYEGAEGSSRIQSILQSYEKSPPALMAGLKVVRFTNYHVQEIRDCEGDILPRELLFFIELENGARYGVRGSGTEPKIKFYMFARHTPPPGKTFVSADLVSIKLNTIAFLETLWKAIEVDARQRAEK